MFLTEMVIGMTIGIMVIIDDDDDDDECQCKFSNDGS